MTVQELANAMSVADTEIVRILFVKGMAVNITSKLGYDDRAGSKRAGSRNRDRRAKPKPAKSPRWWVQKTWNTYSDVHQ